MVIAQGTVSYSPKTPTTGGVLITVGLGTAQSVHFSTAGWSTADGGLTYTKTYYSNFTGEIVSFIGSGGNRETQELKVTRIMPEVDIAYDILGPTLTAGPVTSTLIFSGDTTGPQPMITNNDGSPDYIFLKNGNFTFTYHNGRGTFGSLTAVVDWIDAWPGFQPFLTTWRTTTNYETLVIPITAYANYYFEVNW